MNKKVTGIVSYIAIIGWIIAFVAGDKEGAKFHLNQSLVINVVSLVNSYILSWILGYIPFVGPIVSLVISILILVCWVLGLAYAIKEEEKEVPLLGSIKILK